MGNTSKPVRLNATESCEQFIMETSNTVHLFILVPGTTDPVNINESITNNANIKYWDAPFLKKVLAFANSYPFKKEDVIDGFSWTGDNQIEARQHAARMLLTMIKNATYMERTTPNKRNNIHFICHSHGGNVIHEFTQMAAKDPEFTDRMKVRSIVYLSTPFFNEQAQINTDVLHPHCDIINVYNKYDLTQRFVANFSMHQMPSLLNRLQNNNKLKQAFKNLSETATSSIVRTTSC